MTRGKFLLSLGVLLTAPFLPRLAKGANKPLVSNVGHEEPGWVILINEWNMDSLNYEGEVRYKILSVFRQTVKMRQGNEWYLMRVDDWNIGNPPITYPHYYFNGVKTPGLREGSSITFAYLTTVRPYSDVNYYKVAIAGYGSSLSHYCVAE